jgi:hypothetical protein
MILDDRATNIRGSHSIRIGQPTLPKRSSEAPASHGLAERDISQTLPVSSESTTAMRSPAAAQPHPVDRTYDRESV